MFLSKDLHILSSALMQTAVLNIASDGVDAVFRKVMASKISALLPMTGNDYVWYGELFLSTIQIVITFVIFLRARRILTRKMGLVPKNDQSEMAKLQEEYIPDGISTLSMYSIYQLFRIWAFILIGIRIVYDVSSIAYRRMVSEITLMLSDINNVAISGNLVRMYNNSHGFKYIGMFMAVVIGIFVTGVFLKDRILKIMSAALSSLFMLTFLFVNISSISFRGLFIGVVWTSVFFHILETVGLVILSVYLSKKYRGL